MKPEYSRTTDPDVVSVLERGDVFLGTRRIMTKEGWSERPFKYRVLYPGVYFGHSGNWVIRCKGRFPRKAKEEFEIIEHIIVNAACIHKFKFSVGHIMQARARKLKGFKPKVFIPESAGPKTKENALAKIMKSKKPTSLAQALKKKPLS